MEGRYREIAKVVPMGQPNLVEAMKFVLKSRGRYAAATRLVFQLLKLKCTEIVRRSRFGLIEMRFCCTFSPFPVT